MDVLLAEKIDMGTLPDWIAALGSILAFGGLSLGLWWEARRRREDQDMEARLRREDQDRDREDREREAANNAFRVYGEFHGSDEEGYEVVVWNDSQHPVYDVEVTLQAVNNDIDRPPVDALAIRRIDAASEVTLAVDNELVGDLADHLGWSSRQTLDLTAKVVRVALLFTDGTGQGWYRYERKTLSRRNRVIQSRGNWEAQFTRLYD